MLMNKSYLESQKKWVVQLHGEIDIYNAPELKKELELAIETHCANMHVDCEQLSYIDSTGLGVLVSVLKKLRERGYKIIISGLKPHIYKIFELTDLNKLFEFEEGTK